MSLDDSKLTQFRKLQIMIIQALGAAQDQEAFLLMMGFPADLPDLGTLKPPGHNSRPEGVASSWRVKQERGELPLYYE